MRLMALDLGEKRIGVALSDAMGWLASPLTVIKRGNRPLEIDAIITLARQHQVSHIIIGYPRNMSGEAGPQAKRVEKYVEALGARLQNQDSQDQHVILSYWDERLSTWEAERMIHEAGKRVQRDTIDAMAAAVILQGFLDARRTGRADEEGSICTPTDAT